jgi:hypothetical protein
MLCSSVIPFGQRRALIDRMIRIALDVHHRRLDVARAIAERVDNHAAAHRAKGTGGTRFGRARDFQLSRLG